MKPNELIAKLDDARIAEAIAAAEAKGTGEIRVCISSRPREDPLAAARERFHKLGMDRTKRRNAVLIFFVPLTQKFAVYGDVGVHEKCGPEFWSALVDGMKPRLKEGQYTEAIVFAVAQVGEVLARHFPPDPSDRDELSNQVVND